MVWQEMANRRMEGVLRYLDDTDNIILRDFRVMEDFEITPTSPTPPWKGKVDGMITCFGLETDESSEDAYRWLQRGGVPVISLVPEWHHPKIPIVCTNNNAVMQMAVDYLIEHGHNHFAFIGETINPVDIARRRNIFGKLLSDQGRELLYCNLAEPPRGSIEDIDRAVADVAMMDFLREAPKPLAVFAITDRHARSICWICQELGLDIPGEVAILGTGNLTISRSHSPTISSVQTPHERVGFEAMKLLHHLMDGGKPPARTKLIPPIEVVERKTTCLRQPPKLGDVRRALDFIRAHAYEGITVKEVVNNLGMNRRTLEKHFKNSMGHSPGQEIKNLRLARAKKLLAETGLSIIRVSQMTGFREPTRLNRFFREHAGMSPSEYRKKFKSL